MDHLSFDAVPTKSRCWIGTFNSAKSAAHRIVSSQRFNTCVEVLFPDRSKLSEVTDVLSGVQYFRGVEDAVNLLRNAQTYSGFAVLTEGAKLSCDDCVTMLPEGKIVLR
jgi:hypothetical protein